METNIQEWGNSLGVRLPKAITQSQSLVAGTRVRIHETDGVIVIEPVYDTAPTLRDLLKGITPENLHKEESWGESVGNEIW